MGSTGYTPLLPGIGFSQYRSFATWQQFQFPTKVTVLVGINNSGKSNVLRFLQQVLPTLHNKGRSPGHQRPPRHPKLNDLDLPRGFAATTPLEIGVPVALGTRGAQLDPERRVLPPSVLGDYQETVMSLLREDDGYYWSRFVSDGQQFTQDESRIGHAITQWRNWPRHSQDANRALGGGIPDVRDVMRRLLDSIGGFSSLPEVVTISSSRRVEATEEVVPDWFSGRGIIRALASRQSPTHDKWEQSKRQWAAINRFVQTVLDSPDASLSIPHDFSTIQVKTGQRVLPLASLGSGVEQVIVLAAAATVTTGSLVCIEEPETNLHPLLQKKLVRYLTDETDNQYIIATHSSHLLDDARVTAHHVRLTTDGSVAHLARRPHELVEICHDLGYRPSDLLQANCVIWVEGPSDRIYIRRWLELIDSELTEGIDYSIMFYGGALLAHLTASEEALKQFINLRHLNRASAIVIDSDKTSSRKRISETKKRICAEFDEAHPAPGFAWVTKCYTIENYIPGPLLKMAVKRIHPTVRYEPVSQWENPLPSMTNGRRFDFDKVGIANAVAPTLQGEHLNEYDLRDRVTALAKFIRDANGLSTAPDPST